MSLPTHVEVELDSDNRLFYIVSPQNTKRVWEVLQTWQLNNLLEDEWSSLHMYKHGIKKPYRWWTSSIMSVSIGINYLQPWSSFYVFPGGFHEASGVHSILIYYL